MAEITTVEVIYGKIKATLKLSYRWYVIGSDPWEAAKVTHPVPCTGHWFDTQPYVTNPDRTLYDEKGRRAMTFKNFDRTKKWSSGNGTFHDTEVTYHIPAGAKIKWVITDVD